MKASGTGGLSWNAWHDHGRTAVMPPRPVPFSFERKVFIRPSRFHLAVRFSFGHHGACHRGAMFTTRSRRPPHDSSPPPGLSGWGDLQGTSLHAGKQRGGGGWDAVAFLVLNIAPR